MSYDIDFRVKVEGTNQFLSVGDCDANITWNVRKIIMLSTGLPWNNEENNGLCSEVIPKIAAGLRELYVDPQKYKPYEAKNGWGTVEGVRRFFQQILSSWEDFQYREPDLARVATFWVV